MKTFLLSTQGQQSQLLVFLFLTVIFSLFLLMVVCTGQRDRKKIYLNLATFLVLFALLVLLTDDFDQISRGQMPKEWIPVPMPVLWGIAGIADLLFLWETDRLYRLRLKSLNRNSVKEAMDQLPGGICYFTMAGSVKLCNLQMHRLFRTLAQKDLQTLRELEEALSGCGPDTGIICLSAELQNYLFPDGKVWHFRKSLVRGAEGTPYTEVIFSDLTEQYERELELKKQTKELKEISRKLRLLSDNVLILTKEKEVLAAKTKLHDQMGAGLTAVRQILMRPNEADTENALNLLRQAVSAVKNDNEYPPERDELSKFLQDAQTIGVEIDLSGTLPEQETISSVFLMAMRECLSNGVRHAGASRLWIEMEEDEHSASIHITNDGTPPEGEIVPKGGLHNLYRYVLDRGGRMEIRWKPSFELTITLPEAKVEKV